MDSYQNILQADVKGIQRDLEARLQKLLQVADRLVNVDVLLNQIRGCDRLLLNSLIKHISNKSLVLAQRLFIIIVSFLAYPSSRHACFSRSSISISIISSASLFDILFRKRSTGINTQVGVSFANITPTNHEHNSEAENVTKQYFVYSYTKIEVVRCCCLNKVICHP